MKCDLCGGPQENKNVSYIIETEGSFHVVEHVPAKVCIQCGERLYSPETVKKIQNAIFRHQKPDKVIKTPVIDYVSIG